MKLACVHFRSQQDWEELGYCIKPVWEKTPKGQKCSESIKKKKKSRLFSELKNSDLALGPRGSFWSLIRENVKAYDVSSIG